MKSLLSISHISAGFVAVLVGYSSSAVIIFQAATAAGASAAEISSWLWALGVGMGLTSIGLSLFYRTPILTAWSTPGAALLVTGLPGLSMPEAIGIFIFSSALITFFGVIGWVDKFMNFVPSSLAAAMLAGVLLPFCLDLLVAFETQVLLVGLMLLTYLIVLPLSSQFVIPITLIVGVFTAIVLKQFQFEVVEWGLAKPVWISPEFSLQALIGVGVPLFVVTMTSQNIPGIAVLRTNNYNVPASPLISWTGITGVFLAPLGGFAFNLAAITAAICMSGSAGADRKKRYFASVWAGFFYLLTGLFGTAVVSLFYSLPAELVAAIAGLALLGTFGNSLTTLLKGGIRQEPALLTFLVTASGITLFGIGSAFWGLVIGLTAHKLLLLVKYGSSKELSVQSN